jgi:hypothetical protein
MLERLGFDLKLLGSQNHVRKKLGDLNSEQLEMLKEHLARCGHPRFRKEFALSRHIPYGNSAEFREAISKADVLKVAKLIRIIGVLLQTKVYLFWKEANLRIRERALESKDMRLRKSYKEKTDKAELLGEGCKQILICQNSVYNKTQIALTRFLGSVSAFCSIETKRKEKENENY